MRQTHKWFSTLEGLLELDREWYAAEGIVAYRCKRGEGGWKYYSEERAKTLAKEYHIAAGINQICEERYT